MEPCRATCKIEIHSVGYRIPVDLFYSCTDDDIGDVSVSSAVVSHGFIDHNSLNFNGILCIYICVGQDYKTGGKKVILSSFKHYSRLKATIGSNREAFQAG